MWYVTSLYLQQVLGLSPLDAGLTFLPMALTIMVTAQRAGGLVSRFGVRLGARQRAAHDDRRAAAASRGSSRAGARSCYVVILPGAADRGRDRAVDRPVDDRGDPRGARGPGGSRLGARQHVAPGRRRPRARPADHARHAAHDEPGRNRRAGARRADRRLPAGLPDRRRAVAAAALLTFALLAAPSRGGAPRRHGGSLANRVALVVAAWPVSSSRSRATGRRRSASTRRRRAHFVSAPASTRRRSADRQARTSEQARRPATPRHADFYNLSQPPMVGQSGPLILDNHLQPVWFKPGAGGRRRLQPEPPDVQGQARARVVAGRGHEHRADPRAASTSSSTSTTSRSRSLTRQGGLDPDAAHARDRR